MADTRVRLRTSRRRLSLQVRGRLSSSPLRCNFRPYALRAGFRGCAAPGGVRDRTRRRDAQGGEALFFLGLGRHGRSGLLQTCGRGRRDIGKMGGDEIVCSAAAAAAAGAGAAAAGGGGVVLKSGNVALRMAQELGSTGGILLVLFLGLSGFFALAETSITTLWPWKVYELAQKEGENSPFQLVRKDVTRFVSTCLLGSTVTNIAATALMTETATSVLGSSTNALTVVTVAMTVIMLLFTEIMPKSLAVQSATQVARILINPLSILASFLYPISEAFNLISKAILGIFGFTMTTQARVSEDELKLVLAGAETSGAIDEGESDMIENVLDLEQTAVSDIMTPLFDVVAVEDTAPLRELWNLWESRRFSRIPVYQDRIDNIVGLCYSMDLLEFLHSEKDKGSPSSSSVMGADTSTTNNSIGNLAHDKKDELLSAKVTTLAKKLAYFVPESMTVWNLLREFRLRNVHMAIVVNEFGGAAGLVTLEDVVEEIVGEIFDENDTLVDDSAEISEIGKELWQIKAEVELEAAGEAMGVVFPEGDYQSVGGYTCYMFNHIPLTGETMEVDLTVPESWTADENGNETRVMRSVRRAKLLVKSGTDRMVKVVTFQLCDGETCDVDDDPSSSSSLNNNSSKNKNVIAGDKNAKSRLLHPSSQLQRLKTKVKEDIFQQKKEEEGPSLTQKSV